MVPQQPPRPLPVNPDCVRPRIRDAAANAIDRIRTGQLLRNQPFRDVGCLVWIAAFPFLFLVMYLLLVIAVSAGAAIERAITGW